MSNIVKAASAASKLVSLAAAFGLAGCVSTVPTPHVAMLEEGASVASVQNHPKWGAFRKEGFDPKTYSAVIIEPVVFDAASKKAVSSERQAALSEVLRAQLASEFGKDFRIVSEAGPGVLRVKSAITAVGNPKTLLNALTMAAVVIPATQGGSAVAAEVTDAQSGERLVALRGTATGSIGPVGYLSRDQQSRVGLRTLATSLYRAVVRPGYVRTT